jgi:hypothetical protein
MPANAEPTTNVVRLRTRPSAPRSTALPIPTIELALLNAVIDSMSPKQRRKFMASIDRMAGRRPLDGCIQVAENYTDMLRRSR